MLVLNAASLKKPNEVIMQMTITRGTTKYFISVLNEETNDNILYMEYALDQPNYLLASIVKTILKDMSIDVR